MTDDDDTVRFDDICSRFDAEWSKSTEPPDLGPYLNHVSMDSRSKLFSMLLAIDVEHRRTRSLNRDANFYKSRFPQQSDLIEGIFVFHQTAASDTPGRTVDAEVTTSLQDNGNPRHKTYAGRKARHFGDYELLEKIAQGGMGVVYKARQASLNRVVALKMILTGEFANEREVKRFHSEAEAAAKLDHPGIVPIFEIGEHEGRHYFSMAFIEGKSLADRLRDGPLPPTHAADLLAEICDAVACAHEKGVIHRDLKPGNVLIDTKGTPRVTDFGLAKQVDSDTELTRTGQVIGTPSYFPPEQASGKRDEIGVRSDVYSLGAILYCLLTGRPPFQAASTVETVMQVLHQEPVAPRTLNQQLPIDLNTICMKCLSKEPAKRYESAEALAGDLRRFLAGQPITARPIKRLERTWMWCKRNPRATATISFVSAMLVAVVIVVTAERRKSVRNQVQSTVAAINSTRGIILPPLETLRAFPQQLFLQELRSQFNEATERKLPLSFVLADRGDLRLDFLLSQIQEARADDAANFVDAFSNGKDDSLNAIRKASNSLKDTDDPALRHKARLAMLCLHLGDASLASDMCQPRPDPIQRTIFIDECSSWCGNLVRLSQVAKEREDGPLQSALCLAVGGMQPSYATSQERREWQSLLSDWYRHHPDPGAHSAARWGLSKWAIPLPKIASGEPNRNEKSERRLSQLSLRLQELELAISDGEKQLENEQVAWERNLLSQEQDPVAHLEQGLIAHYSFERDQVEFSDKQPTDPMGKVGLVNRISGKSDAKRHTLLSRGEDFEPGVVGSAIGLRGTILLDSNVAIDLDCSESFSVGFWILLDNINPGTIVTTEGRNDFSIELMRGKVLRMEVGRDNGLPARFHAAIPNVPSGWHHIAVTCMGECDEESVQLYVDADPVELMLAESQDDARSPSTRSGPIEGNPRTRIRYGSCEGFVDELRIYNRALKAGDFDDLVREDWTSLIQLPTTQRTPHQQQLVRDGQAVTDTDLISLRRKYRKMKQQMDADFWSDSNHWRFVTSGITMLRIPADRVFNESGVPIETGEAFLISDCEITHGQFHQFLNDDDYPSAEKPLEWQQRFEPGPSAEHPIDLRTWDDAVLFCNWLSHREGLTPCYLRTGKTRPKGRSGFGGPFDRFNTEVWRFDVSASGYRLPSSTEWEIACRAGAETEFFFGNDESWLQDYAVFATDEYERCATKRPNASGLFDTHGNLWEWCHSTDREWLPIDRDQGSSVRIIRGGSFRDFANPCRSSHSRASPHVGILSGFRVVRRSVDAARYPGESKTPTSIDAFGLPIQSARTAEKHFEFGKELLEKGKLDQSRANLRAALRLLDKRFGGNPLRQSNLSDRSALSMIRVYFDLAKLEQEAGDATRESEVWREAVSQLERFPMAESPAYWGYLGRSYYRLDRLQDARQAFEKVISIRGEKAPSVAGGPRWWFLTMILARLGETEKAKGFYESLVVQLGEQKDERQVRFQEEAAALLGLSIDKTK